MPNTGRYYGSWEWARCHPTVGFCLHTPFHMALDAKLSFRGIEAWLQDSDGEPFALGPPVVDRNHVTIAVGEVTRKVGVLFDFRVQLLRAPTGLLRGVEEVSRRPSYQCVVRNLQA